MIAKTGSIENDSINAFLLRLGRQHLAESTSLLDGRTGTFKALGHRRQADHRMTRMVVDDLCLDVAQAAVHDEPRSFLSAQDFLADAESPPRSRDLLLLLSVLLL